MKKRKKELYKIKKSNFIKKFFRANNIKIKTFFMGFLVVVALFGILIIVFGALSTKDYYNTEGKEGELASLGPSITPIPDIRILECRGKADGKSCNIDAEIKINQGVCLYGRCMDCYRKCNSCESCGLNIINGVLLRICGYQGDGAICYIGDLWGTCELENGVYACNNLQQENPPTPTPTLEPPENTIIPIPEDTLNPTPTP